MTSSRRIEGAWVPVTGLLLGFGLCAGACGGPQRPSHLPSPVYEQPELPPWEPEVPEDPLEQGAMEGEWVEDPEDVPEELQETAPEAPPADSGPQRNSGEPGSETPREDPGTPRQEKPDSSGSEPPGRDR